MLGALVPFFLPPLECMERRYLMRLASIAALVGFALLIVVSIRQTAHLERLVLEGNRRVASLEQSVERLRQDVASGGIRSASTSTGEHFAQRYYQPDEWEALRRPGNLLSLPTAPQRVADGTNGGVLQRSFIADIPSLNPLTSNAADVSELYHYISDGLAGRERDNPDNIVPGLAYRIEANDDFTEFHIWLKRGVRWHQPAVDTHSPEFAWLAGDRFLVADDFVFGMELIQDPQVEAAPLRNYYEKFEGIEVINDHEFIVRWSASEYTNMSATLGLAALPRWLYGHDRDGTPFDETERGRRFNSHWYNLAAIGVGPYRFVRWEQGGRIRVERNVDYHGEAPFVDAIEFRVIGDATARLNNLRAGQLDYIPIEPPEYKNEVLNGGTPGFKTGELHHEIYDGPMYRYLGWNADTPYFSDRRVRQAMTHAFNRQLTIDVNMNGLGVIISGPYSIATSAYDQSIAPLPFDLKRAAELLEQAGWVDRDGDGVREKSIDGKIIPFRFSMLTYGHRPEMIAAMEIFREDLRKIGVSMNILPAEWSVLIQKMDDKDFDAFTGGWLLGWETDLYQLWHSSQADEPRGSNRIGFRNPDADRIIEEVRRTFDEDARNALFHQFHALVHEEQPYTFWFQGRNVGAWNQRVHNVSFSPLRPFDSSLTWFISPVN